MTTPFAPLPYEDLAFVLVDEFGSARTLPAAAYLSSEVLAWERRHLFEGTWICLGRSDLLPEPKCQLGVRVGDDGLVLARDESGILRGFFNSCRHRGHEL